MWEGGDRGIGIEGGQIASKIEVVVVPARAASAAPTSASSTTATVATTPSPATTTATTANAILVIAGGRCALLLLIAGRRCAHLLRTVTVTIIRVNDTVIRHSRDSYGGNRGSSSGSSTSSTELGPTALRTTPQVVVKLINRKDTNTGSTHA